MASFFLELLQLLSVRNSRYLQQKEVKVFLLSPTLLKVFIGHLNFLFFFHMFLGFVNLLIHPLTSQMSRQAQ